MKNLEKLEEIIKNVFGYPIQKNSLKDIFQCYVDKENCRCRLNERCSRCPWNDFWDKEYEPNINMPENFTNHIMDRFTKGE